MAAPEDHAPARTVAADRPRVLLLGGAGFIGSHLAEELVAAGYPVRVFGKTDGKWDNLAHLGGRVERFGGDFQNQIDVRQALAGCGVVFHLIGSTLPASSNANPIYDLETNLLPTIRFLEEARAAAVRRVFFISSGGTVYGPATRLPIPEDHPTEPLCSYGIAKLAIEKYLALFRHLHGMRTTVLRFSNPYGERQNPAGAQGAVAVFLGRVRAGSAIEIWGTGEVVRDYIYIKDAAHAARLLLEAGDGVPDDRVFNVGSGIGVSVNQLVEQIRIATGRTVEVVRKPGRAVDVPANVLDIARLRGATGFSPRTSLGEGLARTWRWLEGQPP